MYNENVVENINIWVEKYVYDTREILFEKKKVTIFGLVNYLK